MTRRMEAEKSARAEVAVVAACPIRRIHLDQFVAFVCTVIRQPSPQKVQIVSARLSIQGRYSYIDSRLVMAPTGQICTQPPQNSQSNWWAAEVFDLGHCPAADRRQRLDVHDFIAITDATQTLHAAVHLRFDERAEIFFLKDALGFDEAAGGRGIFDAKSLAGRTGRLDRRPDNRADGWPE